MYASMHQHETPVTATVSKIESVVWIRFCGDPLDEFTVHVPSLEDAERIGREIVAHARKLIPLVISDEPLIVTEEDGEVTPLVQRSEPATILEDAPV